MVEPRKFIARSLGNIAKAEAEAKALNAEAFKLWEALFSGDDSDATVRLQLHALAYNLANFLRTLAAPEAIEKWTLTSLRERLIKTGARLVRHARYAVFQMAEAALPRTLFAGVL